MQSLLANLRELAAYLDQFSWLFFYIAVAWCSCAALYYYTVVVKNVVLDCLASGSVLDSPWLTPDFYGNDNRSVSFRKCLIYVGGFTALISAFIIGALASDSKLASNFLDASRLNGIYGWLLGMTIFAAVIHSALLIERGNAAANNDSPREFELDSAMWAVVVIALGLQVTSVVGLLVEPLRHIFQLLTSLATALTALSVLYFRWRWNREDRAPAPQPVSKAITPSKAAVPVPTPPAPGRPKPRRTHWNPTDMENIDIVVTERGGIKVTDKEGNQLR